MENQRTQSAEKNCFQALSTLDALITRNEKAKEKLKQNLLFKLIESGHISENNREEFLAYLQVWANYFQKTMMLKTALCDDPSFIPMAQKHFQEEYAHDKLLENDRKTKIQKKDALLEAICNWFPSKMLSLNQYEQIVVMNLCLEGAANVFYKSAIAIIDPEKKSHYFNAHDEVDEAHEKMGLALLENLPEKVYTRLLDVQEETWNMIEALLNRIAELTKQGTGDEH